MRTLETLLAETSAHADSVLTRHAYCRDALESHATATLQAMMPAVGALYTRGSNGSSARVHIAEVQIAELVVPAPLPNVSYRYTLADEMRPPPATLLVVQDGQNFLTHYPTARDKLALPPFHLLSTNNGWWGVCLGAERCPDVASLARLLSVANFTSSYVSIVSLGEVLGTGTLPTPFDAWSRAWDLLAKGEEVNGFQRIQEMRL